MYFRVENETETNQKLRALSIRSMIAELPDFVLVLISAIVSGSLIVWADLLGSFSAMLHSAVVYLITRKIGRIAGDSWRFDVTRLEVMTSFICDLIMIAGYLALVVSAVCELPSPSAVNSRILADCRINEYLARMEQLPGNQSMNVGWEGTLAGDVFSCARYS